MHSAEGTRGRIVLGAAFSLRALVGGVTPHDVFMQEQSPARIAQRVCRKREAPAQRARPHFAESLPWLTIGSHNAIFLYQDIRGEGLSSNQWVGRKKT